MKTTDTKTSLTQNGTCIRHIWMQLPFMQFRIHRISIPEMNVQSEIHVNSATQYSSSVFPLDLLRYCCTCCRNDMNGRENRLLHSLNNNMIIHFMEVKKLSFFQMPLTRTKIPVKLWTKPWSIDIFQIFAWEGFDSMDQTYLLQNELKRILLEQYLRCSNGRFNFK